MVSCPTSKLSKSYAAYLNTITNHCEPQTFQEASCQEVWRNAMEEELRALTNHNTWSVVRLPPEKRQLVASGSTRSNSTQMDRLKGTKLGWWLEDSLKHMSWTTRKHSLQLPR